MQKFPFLVAAVFLAGTLLPMPPSARGVTEEEKQKAFLSSREDAGESKAKKSTPEPAPAKKTPQKRKAKAKPKAARKKRHHRPASEETPTPHHRPQPTPESTPEPKIASEPKPPAEPNPAPHPTHSAPSPESTPARPAPTPSSTPQRTPASNSVVVQKSGAEEAETPVPPSEKEHGWSWWPFGRPVHYKYLTSSIRDALDRAPVSRHRWRYIVVHNSGTRQGNAKAFDYYHLHVRKMPNGLAYHFVIGNGTSSGNGAIEIGGRWTRQINGGHVHSDYLNNIALGICLVGDFNHDKPTPQQLEALDELIRYLRNRVGKTDHKLATIKAHKDINPPQWPTDCPGDKFPYRWLYTRFD